MISTTQNQDRETGLSIIVPALNEEDNIVLTVNELVEAGNLSGALFEIILVNDGSDDDTGKAMDALSAGYPHIKVIHHARRLGVGAAYGSGIALVRYRYVILLPGDYEVDKRTYQELFRAIGKADLVVGHRMNQRDARPLHRVVLSRLYTHVLNTLFGLRFSDFDSLVVYPYSYIMQSPLRSSGYTYQMEMLVGAIRSGLTFVQVPVYLNPVEDRSSRSLSWQTLVDVVGTALRLLFKLK